MIIAWIMNYPYNRAWCNIFSIVAPQARKNCYLGGIAHSKHAFCSVCSMLIYSDTHFKNTKFSACGGPVGYIAILGCKCFHFSPPQAENFAKSRSENVIFTGEAFIVARRRRKFLRNRGRKMRFWGEIASKYRIFSAPAAGQLSNYCQIVNMW